MSKIEKNVQLNAAIETFLKSKQNWFETLRESLDAEGLNDKWPLGLNLSYGETARFITDDFYLISVYRSNTGRYERPVWYSTISKAERKKLESA